MGTVWNFLTHGYPCQTLAFPCGTCVTLPHLVPSVKNDCLCTLPFLHIPPTPGHHDFDPLTSHKFWVTTLVWWVGASGKTCVWWRPVGHHCRRLLSDLHELWQFQMQLIVFSGMVPLQLAMFGLGKGTIIICTCTIWPKLQYVLKKPMSNNQLIATCVQEVLSQEPLSMSRDDWVLIFVPYMDQGEHLAKVCNCEFYHGGKTLNDTEGDIIFGHLTLNIHHSISRLNKSCVLCECATFKFKLRSTSPSPRSQTSLFLKT